MTGATVVPTTGKRGRGRPGGGGVGGIFSGVVFCRGLGFAVVTDNGGGSLKRSKENISNTRTAGSRKFPNPCQGG